MENKSKFLASDTHGAKVEILRRETTFHFVSTFFSRTTHVVSFRSTKTVTNNSIDVPLGTHYYWVDKGNVRGSSRTSPPGLGVEPLTIDIARPKSSTP